MGLADTFRRDLANASRPAPRLPSDHLDPQTKTLQQRLEANERSIIAMAEVVDEIVEALRRGNDSSRSRTTI